MRDVSTPPNLALPPSARRVTIATSGGPLAALECPARPGPRHGCALLVPGFTGSKEDFLAVLEPLSRRGFLVLALDLRGQYESPGPDEESAYRLDRLAADVLEVATALAEEYGDPHLLGHSLGGLVVRAAVLAGAPAASVTLLDSGPGPIPDAKHPMLLALRAALPEADLEDVWTAKEALDRADGWQPPSPEVLAFLHGRFVANSPWGLRAKAGILLDAPDRTEDLARAVPGDRLLVAYGEWDDAWSPQEQAAMARRLSAREVVLAGCAHSPAAEDPDATATVLAEFWTSVSTTSDRRPADDADAVGAR